ncbi:hypothetical protein D3C75_885840 [compost metagenome]
MVDNQDGADHHTIESEHPSQKDQRKPQHTQCNCRVISGCGKRADSRQRNNHHSDWTRQSGGHRSLADDEHTDNGQGSADHLRQADGGLPQHLHRHFHD